MATHLEHCQIQPSPCNYQELSLPLTHFDIPFLKSSPTQRLIFFNFPCTKSHFHETLIPSLKKSLSTTLTHFLPLAGNIILPPNSGMPENRYVSGDSVSLTIAESDQDFNYLTGNHQRVADEFYACVPQLPPANRSSDCVVIPVIALQITLFPGQGICIGLTNYHAVGDGSSIVNFVKTWALAHRFGDGFYLKDGKTLPVIDKTLVPDPEELNSKAWNFVKKSRRLPVELPPVNFPINRIRSTFILQKHQIQNLKNHVLSNRSDLTREISSFVLACAYAWTCSVKSEEETNNDDDEEPVYFSFAADCRRRLIPPLPESYFGNCVVFVTADSRRGLLKQNRGILTAVESIGEAVRKSLYSEEGIFESADWPRDFGKYAGKWLMSVAGSPRFDMYEADFGWGSPEKYEFVHLDRERSISVCKSREFEGGLEIGLSKKKIETDSFERVFHQGLEIMKPDMASTKI